MAISKVTGGGIADGSLSVSDIADDAVTAAKLANSINTDIGTGVTGNTTADAALPKAGGAMTGAITTNSTFDTRDVATDGTKLDTVETNAKDDQTGAQIKTAYEAETNAFTDAQFTKLGNIETNAKDDQTNAEIKSAIEAGTSIALGGSPTTTTQSQADNSTKIATTAYTDVAIAALADSAPSTLNTLNELAAALGDDANYATTTTNLIGTKLNLSGGTMTGHTLHGDNVNNNYGTGDDLKIYHNGVNSYINNTTGSLYIRDSDGDIYIQAKNNENSIVANNDGSVQVYYDNALKLATSTSGVTVTGTVTATSFAGSGSALTGVDAATVSTTAPSSPSQGDMWFDSTSGVTAMKVYSGTVWDQMSNKFTATGGSESVAGGYKYHTFTSSGTFTPSGGKSVEYLIVAGGGSGGGMTSGGSYHGAAGGGGAGGMIYNTLSVTAQAYSIVIGGGGAGSSGGTGSNGANSTGFGLTSIGGGHGSRGNSGVAAASGGSGGGAGREATTPANGTSGQGNAGGAYTNGAGGNASGGGGKGSVGGPYNGGSGASWNGTTYAGGGGGGEGGNQPANATSSGGSGGGGVGGRINFGTGGNATVNLGGGGGGGAAGNNATSTSSGGNGSSGIVIIRYAV